MGLKNNPQNDDVAKDPHRRGLTKQLLYKSAVYSANLRTC